MGDNFASLFGQVNLTVFDVCSSNDSRCLVTGQVVNMTVFDGRSSNDSRCLVSGQVVKMLSQGAPTAARAILQCYTKNRDRVYLPSYLAKLSSV